MYVSPETLALIFDLGIEQDKLVQLFKALDRDALAIASPAATSGVNEERERLRNESTAAERKRAKDRERQRVRREVARQSSDIARQSPDIAATTGDASRDTSCAPTCTQVVTPSLPSLRSEELKPPEKTTSSTPKGAETGRGTRIAENWWPVDDYDPSAFGLSREQHDAELAKFLDYWRSVPGAKGRKTDWPATWRNWMRRASENQPRKAHERPDHDPKFAARQANYARALAGADSAAGRTWKP